MIGKLSIDGCIKYIVLGRKFFLDEVRIMDLLDIIVDPLSICYHKFTPHSFATTFYHSHGYRTNEISFKIISVLKSNISNPLYKNYVEWLNTEQGYCVIINTHY